MNGDELSVRLARNAVAELAPGELNLFEETTADFFTVPHAARQAPVRAEPLGMGVETIGVLITTVALAASVEVVKQLSVQAVDAAGERMRPWITRWFRRRRSGPEPDPLPIAPVRPGGTAASGPPTALPALPPEELLRLRGIAVVRAKALGLPEERAELLADAIIGGLITSPGTAATPRTEPTAE
ncbi:hypothetical protein [Streptomyces sp. AK02-01A]|uniref:hypothetical protein n=1 Tax=Streptomyces sp. AK02-01A TaxID=3028648 RepID=UPI0029BDB264|nr:hypothetical protein [Streptomyces sp. AK02-01A]MDX3853471.1 hypothetical protein [Streptomyces sp. AK02-01A]